MARHTVIFSWVPCTENAIAALLTSQLPVLHNKRKSGQAAGKGGLEIVSHLRLCLAGTPILPEYEEAGKAYTQKSKYCSTYVSCCGLVHLQRDWAVDVRGKLLSISRNN